MDYRLTYETQKKDRQPKANRDGYQEVSAAHPRCPDPGPPVQKEAAEEASHSRGAPQGGRLGVEEEEETLLYPHPTLSLKGRGNKGGGDIIL